MFIPKTYTVESVTSGHPDKICDQVSDAILDACLAGDAQSRVAVETFGSHGLLIVGGEVTTRAEVDFKSIARRVYREIGHDDEMNIVINIARQSADIAQGVDTGGAGDQGIMYGYATGETPEFLPKASVLAHKLSRGLENLRKDGKIGWLKPDGKTQVTFEEGELKTVLVSTQHEKGVAKDEIKKILTEKLIFPVAGELNENQILVNPTGSFILGGFAADTGLTGRKIMVDTYGGLIPHGGGCFSGKDPTKVDRSAAYMARFAAKNIVAAGLARQCLVSVAYAIGRVEPLMLNALDENGKNISSLLRKFDFRPKAIIERFDLRRPIYRQTASYGHFGNNSFPWEKIVKDAII